jgi:hypothetical protein
VIVAVLVPLATIDPGAALIVDVVADGAPGVRLTLTELASAPPLRVPLTVEVPVVEVEVRVAV